MNVCVLYGRKLSSCILKHNFGIRLEELGKKHTQKKNQPGNSVSPPNFESSNSLLQFTCVGEYKDGGSLKPGAEF